MSAFLEGAAAVDTVVLDDGVQEFDWEVGGIVLWLRLLHNG